MKTLVTFGLAAAIAASLTIAATPTADAAPGNWCQSRSLIGVLGDSLSSGWTLDPTHPYQDEPTNPGIWVYSVATQTGSQVDNQSVAGAATGDYISGGSLYTKTQEFGTSKPNMVLVFLSTNDWLAGVYPSTYQANMVTLYNEISAESPSSSIVFVGMPDTSTYHTTTYPWLSYITAETNAAVATGAGLILMSQVVPADSTGTTPGVYNTDNTHLTLAGQKIMGAYALGRVLTICG